MTTETDLRSLRDLTLNPPRGHYRVRHLSVRDQLAKVPGDKSGQQRSAAPAHHADVVQVGLFADLLRQEHAELGAVAGIEIRRHGALSATDQMVQLQARMQEVPRLLDALEKRFVSSGLPTNGATATASSNLWAKARTT
ncbi:hypothetical protein [Mycobacterium genavense]|uniref:hypothetical protein n=1 Tax=Mycobacterium genavense TaxID=36812 RepID=UPI0012EC292D|nr:hypothetical protein [Mycobacterium genavense]